MYGRGSKRIGQVMRVRKVPLLPPSLEGVLKTINKSIKVKKEKLKEKMKEKIGVGTFPSEF